MGDVNHTSSYAHFALEDPALTLKAAVLAAEWDWDQGAPPCSVVIPSQRGLQSFWPP